MVWPAFIAAAGALAENQLSNAFGAAEARKNRNFQERMSNTAYQRAADDMEAAGLNRVLALGQSASTPSGAQAAASPSNVTQSGIMASSAKQQIAQSRAEEQLLTQRQSESEATEKLALANVLTAATQADLNAANAQLVKANTGLAAANTGLTSERTRSEKARATKEERFVPVYDVVGDVVDSVTGMFRSSAKGDPSGSDIVDGHHSSNSRDAQSNNPIKNVFDRFKKYGEKHQNPKFKGRYKK